MEEIVTTVLALPIVKQFVTALQAGFVAGVTRAVVTVLTRRDSDPAFRAKYDQLNAAVDAAKTDEEVTHALQALHDLCSGK